MRCRKCRKLSKFSIVTREVGRDVQMLHFGLPGEGRGSQRWGCNFVNPREVSRYRSICVERAGGVQDYIIYTCQAFPSHG